MADLAAEVLTMLCRPRDRATEPDPLTPNPQRLVLDPHIHPRTWALKKTLEAQFWVADEIQFNAKDTAEFATLPPGLQHMVKMAIAFFLSSDGLVMENIEANFAHEVQWPALRHFYAYQEANEAVHAEVYTNLLNVIEPDEDKRAAVRDGMVGYQSIQDMIQWAQTWMDASKRPFRQRLVAFAIYEGLFFQDKFLCLLLVRSFNKCNSIAESQILIIGDEFGHELNAYLNHAYLDVQCTQDEVEDIMRPAVEINIAFAREALKVEGAGFTLEEFAEYNRFLADNIMRFLRCKPIYGAKRNRLNDRMEAFTLEKKANFFERQALSYQKAAGAKNLHQMSEDVAF